MDSHTMFVVSADDLATFGPYGAFVTVSDALGVRFDLNFDSYATFIPEPSRAWLLLAGLAALSAVRRRVVWRSRSDRSRRRSG